MKAESKGVINKIDTTQEVNLNIFRHSVSSGDFAINLLVEFFD